MSGLEPDDANGDNDGPEEADGDLESADQAPSGADGGGNGSEQAGESLDGEVLSPDDPLTPLRLVKQFADMEGRRIGVQEGKNRVAMRALDVHEKANQRQHEFHTERLASEERGRNKSYALARVVVVYGGGALLAISVLILILLFFGSEVQSELAMTLLKEGFQALGGAGVVLLVAMGIRWLLRSGFPSR